MLHIRRAVSVIIVISIIVTMSSCSSPITDERNDETIPSISEASTFSNAENTDYDLITENIITENLVTENLIKEDFLYEYITNEVYINEILIVENKITELLIKEENVDEVLLCKTIYVPQNNIDEFSQNSQTKELFGDNVNLAPVLAKIAVGAGVIVVLTILKSRGLQEPIASIIVAAADESVKFAKSGAVIGSIFGGVTGAADIADESGITSACLGFAITIAGLVLTAISLVAAVPTNGASGATLAEGIKLVLAGVSTMAAAVTATKSCIDTVKKIKATDGIDINWDNIDWKKAGISSVQRAIKNGADGYMVGSIIGAVYGGVNGYDYYEKFNTPYTSYKQRIDQTPKSDECGKWSEERGESDYILDEPMELPDGTKLTKISYKNAVPDFSPVKLAEVKISQMTSNRDSNFSQADELLSQLWTKIKYQGKVWSKTDVTEFRKSNGYTWHEMSNMEYMQLIPTEVNKRFTHYGGVAEYNAMIGKNGDEEFG